MAKKKKESKKEEKKTPPEGVQRGRKSGDTITSHVRSMMEKDGGVTSEAVIASVLKKWPESKISNAHVGYYRNKFRQEGVNIPSLRSNKKEKVKK